MAEASAACKRLVEAFAHYTAAAKWIQSLLCARGSFQGRVQMPVLSRANSPCGIICSRSRSGRSPSSTVPIMRVARTLSSIYVVSFQINPQNRFGIPNAFDPQTGTQRDHDWPRFGAGSRIATVDAGFCAEGDDREEARRCRL